MGGYTKNIAVIKAIKSGFSSDGGPLSGLVKVEKYGLHFRAEVSLINFAPLTSGRYVTAVTDGAFTVLCEGARCECESRIDTSQGFAAAVCFVNGEVTPIAVAVCGDYGRCAAVAVSELERQERGVCPPYRDEAIAEENYFEYGKDTQGADDVCAGEEEKAGHCPRQNETDSSIHTVETDRSLNAQSDFRAKDSKDCSCRDGAARTGGESKDGRKFSSVAGEEKADGREEKADGRVYSFKDFADFCSKSGEDAHDDGADGDQNSGKGAGVKTGGTETSRNGVDGVKTGGADMGGARAIPLAEDTGFYSQVREEAERLLSTFPHEEQLERAVENSRWVRITYGGKRFYVFGVIYDGERPAYICYGVPSGKEGCPPSLNGFAGYIPAGEGYWVMYQDARNGATIKIDLT